jgi:hypothetical protein
VSLNGEVASIAFPPGKKMVLLQMDACRQNSPPARFFAAAGLSFEG